MRRKRRPPLRELRLQPAAVVGDAALAGGIGDAPALVVAQRHPSRRRRDEQREAVGERRIERFGAEILLAA